jgi:hypothetical protein
MGDFKNAHLKCVNTRPSRGMSPGRRQSERRAPVRVVEFARRRSDVSKPPSPKRISMTPTTTAASTS